MFPTSHLRLFIRTETNLVHETKALFVPAGSHAPPLRTFPRLPCALERGALGSFVPTPTPVPRLGAPVSADVGSAFRCPRPVPAVPSAGLGPAGRRAPSRSPAPRAPARSLARSPLSSRRPPGPEGACRGRGHPPPRACAASPPLRASTARSAVRRGGQVVRRRSRKPKIAGSNPVRACDRRWGFGRGRAHVPAPFPLLRGIFSFSGSVQASFNSSSPEGSTTPHPAQPSAARFRGRAGEPARPSPASAPTSHPRPRSPAAQLLCATRGIRVRRDVAGGHSVPGGGLWYLRDP